MRYKFNVNREKKTVVAYVSGSDLANELMRRLVKPANIITSGNRDAAGSVTNTLLYLTDAEVFNKIATTKLCAKAVCSGNDMFSERVGKSIAAAKLSAKIEIILSDIKFNMQVKLSMLSQLLEATSDEHVDAVNERLQFLAKTLDYPELNDYRLDVVDNF